MKTKSYQRIAVAIILASGLLFGINLLFTNARLKNNLSDEKLKSEILLSEKLSTEKSLAKLQKDIKDVETKNSRLNTLISDANQKIADKTREVEKLAVQAASAKNMKKKNEELESALQKLNQEIAMLSESIEKAKKENKKLSDDLAMTSKTNNGLNSDNNILRAMMSDNYRTEALRGKQNKLTVVARKANKLSVSFDLPGASANNIYFKVVTPQGNEFSSKDDLAAVITITDNNDGLLASSDNSMIGDGGTKRVEMSFKPRKKLSGGVYQFNVYNNDRFIGSTQLRLK